MSIFTAIETVNYFWYKFEYINFKIKEGTHEQGNKTCDNMFTIATIETS